MGSAAGYSRASRGPRSPIDNHGDKNAEKEDDRLRRERDEGEYGGHEDDHRRDHDGPRQPHLMADDPLLLFHGCRTLSSVKMIPLGAEARGFGRPRPRSVWRPGAGKVPSVSLP